MRARVTLLFALALLAVLGSQRLPVLVHGRFVIDAGTSTGGTSFYGYNGAYPAQWGEIGQCFYTPDIADGVQITQVRFYVVVAAGAPSGTAQAFLYRATGTYGTTCLPFGEALVSSGNTASISSTGYTSFLILNYSASPKTLYAVSLRITACSPCDLENYWNFQFQSPSSNNIARWEGSSYSAIAGDKATYEVDGDNLPAGGDAPVNQCGQVKTAGNGLVDADSRHVARDKCSELRCRSGSFNKGELLRPTGHGSVKVKHRLSCFKTHRIILDGEESNMIESRLRTQVLRQSLIADVRKGARV